MPSPSVVASAPSHTHAPSSSLPTAEERDIAQAQQTWLDDSGTTLPEQQSLKGKQRAVDVHDADTGSDDTIESPGTSTYPPVNDDEAETRRIEENLRRWEIAERQKRKAARVSSQNSSSQPSLVDDVTRRASLLWQGKRSKHPSGSGLGLGTHTALQSDDNADTVPLADINVSPTPSPTPSPTRTDSDEAQSDGPFADPPESLSPFADSHQINTTKEPKDSSQVIAVTSPTHRSSLLSPPPRKSTRRSRQPPTPKPLGLPPPKTPPPPITTTSYPKTLPPDPSQRGPQVEETPKETRWWHDWLCGCGEGPDRGGDNQAGRTNPFE
ncbi:hypothetical protein BDQ12DRAFT_717814 [Crucibulum laeve]|uniref:Uncharacterized protein n=1 Tax=Crucibulum laeve TaxID=68775 RepID=A0A5C3MIC7_9AGAR|nr:hypothetical protein BDQ12DRAFT_717814 [Crucibulum laeve]